MLANPAACVGASRVIAIELWEGVAEIGRLLTPKFAHSSLLLVNCLFFSKNIY